MRQRAHISLQTSLQPPPFYLQTQTRSSTRSSRESVPKFPVSLFYSFFSLLANIPLFTTPSSLIPHPLFRKRDLGEGDSKTVKWNHCPPCPRPVFRLFLNCLLSGRLSNPCSTQMSTTLASHVYSYPLETTSALLRSRLGRCGPLGPGGRTHHWGG
ncbi:hypothetical protein BJV77DRAFT_1036521 [Russula vinacea]|nr:hypothetical protein BJV77DRAFT_1036521 [Russula vinacea]